MAINASKTKNATGGGAPIDPIAPGTYPARLVGVIDLGLQAQRPFQGNEKAPAYEILTIYELVDEFLKDEEGNDIKDKPRWINENFPLYSLESEKARSTKRYLALDPTKAKEGNWGDLLETPCMVTVINNPGKGANLGKTYSNISNVAAMRAKEVEGCPPLVNEVLVFDTDEPDMEVWTRIPKWIRDKISSGLEFEGSKLAALVEEVPVPTDEDAEDQSTSEELEDEVPY